MEAQIPNQVEVHYPPDYSTSFTDTLFMYRQTNDDLLKQMVVLSQENRRLAIKVNQFKQSLPPFFINWWNSDQGVQKIGIFLTNLSQSLQSEIQSMNSQLCKCRGQFEVTQADYQEEISEAERLKQQIAELNQRLYELRSKNQSNRQIQMLEEMRPNQIMRELMMKKQMRTLEFSLHQDLQNKINATFQGRLNQDIEKQYYQQKETLIKHLVNRRQKLQVKLNVLTHQLSTLNNFISSFESEKNAELMMKQSIISKHKKLQELRKELEEAKIRKNEALRKKRSLQQSICQQQMERAVQSLDGLTLKYKSLALRTLQLVKRSLESTNVVQIQQMLVQK